MKCPSRNLTTAIAGAGLGLLALDAPAHAADIPLKAPAMQPSSIGPDSISARIPASAAASSSAVLNDGANAATHNVFNGMIGGVQAGYNYRLSSGLLLGVEADFSFPNYFPRTRSSPRSRLRIRRRRRRGTMSGTARGRVGYAAGSGCSMPPAGWHGPANAFSIHRPDGNEEKVLNTRLGWAAGAGLEYGFAPDWSVKLEYLYSRFDDAHVGLSFGRAVQRRHSTSSRCASDSTARSAGRADPISSRATELTDTESDRWEIHGQSTFLAQGHPSFRALYTGANSLTTAPQLQETWSNSLFLNARLWDGGEVYYNPELLQGFGLDNTVGLGGFSNGEAQKSNFPYPHYNTSRLFLRQTFGFGGEQEDMYSGQQQLAGKADISRLTLQVGKFSVLDLFDGNAYAKDTRRDFMNWSIWAPGAFDYAADKLGLTYGITAELNQKQWALRGGYFLMDAESNSNNFDTKVFRRGEYAIELETRYSLFAQPGKLRTIAWINSVNSGSYRDTLNDPALNLDIAQTRTGRTKYGYVINLEQAVTADIGLFGRWSWNDGKTEIMSFTDIDSSLSLGSSIRGAAWGRSDDVIGIAGATNGISRDHRDFLAAGGLGPLVGDGQINYRRERVLEAYYALALTKAITLTADYQFITNPAYNADRGPVSIVSGRLHGEF